MTKIDKRSLNDEEPHHRADRGDRVIALAEQPHVDRRMPFAKLPDDEARQRQRHHDQRADQDRRVEPVEVVAHVENRLQPYKNRRQQEKTNEVETREAPLTPAAIKQRTHDAGGQQRDGNVGVEQEAPAEKFRIPAAQIGAGHEWHHAEHAPKPDAERSQVLRIFAEQHGLPDRDYGAAGEAKQNARGHEKINRVAHGATERHRRVKNIGGDKHPVIAKPRRQPTRDHEAQRDAHHMVGRRPGAKARRHALQIARRVRREDRVARHIGQHQHIAQAKHNVEQQKAPSAQRTRVDHEAWLKAASAL